MVFKHGTPKVFTFIGSKRYIKYFQDLDVIGPFINMIFHMPKIFDYTAEEIYSFDPKTHEIFDDIHRYKMSTSFAVVVVDPDDGYIGDDTREEMEWAISQGLNVMHYQQFMDAYVSPIINSVFIPLVKEDQDVSEQTTDAHE